MPDEDPPQTPPDDDRVGSDPGAPIYEQRTPEELSQRLAEISSIEEVLRIQDQLARFVRDRYEKPVAVLFSDIAGSTAYFERYGDAEGRRMIQRHNDLLIPVIQGRGGKVVKTIGDALMATFPSANLAADAAIGMMQAVHESNARVSHEEERFEIRIGINFGTALVNDRDGDVYGDMVNVAARVQSQAQKTQILISDVVREYLSPTVPLRPAGTFHLKGKSQDFPLFEVLWKQLSRPEIQLEKPNLGGRYVVLELLGSGGMASVWRARDEKLGRDVAVKVLHGHMQLAVATRERFQREAVVAASLVHENIVQVYDYAAQEAPQSFIAMELVEGQQLRAFTERQGALGTVATLLLGNEVARGLSHAHQRNVVHRDLKPENVLVSNTGVVKIADFGIAGVGEMVRLTQTGAQLGTPAYLSPEQVKGGAASHRSDVFALGVMLYEMATGKSPFPGESPAAIMFRIAEGAYPPPAQAGPVDPDLAAIIRRCLARDPKDRYPSAGEVAQALAEGLKRREVGDPRASLTAWLSTGTLPAVKPLDTVDRMMRELPKRGRARLVVAGVVAAALVAGAVGYGLYVRGGGGAVSPGAGGQGPSGASPMAGQTTGAGTSEVSPEAAQPTGAGQEPSGASLVAAQAKGTGAQGLSGASPVAAQGTGAQGSAGASPDAEQTSGTGHAAEGVTSAAGTVDEGSGAGTHHAATRGEAPETTRSAKHPPAERSRRRRSRRERAPSSVATRSPPVRDVGEERVSEYGTLRLTVSGGWADIKIDGVKMGRYPVNRTFTLTEGGHVLELTGNEARRPHRSRILVKAGETLEHAVELEPVQ